MDHTGDRGPASDDDDDDLLRTIRQMVSDEAARAPVKAPSHFPGMDDEPAPAEPVAARPATAAKPLVLGAMVRVDPETPPSPASPPARTDDPVLRALVMDVVREEMEVAMGDPLTARIRQIVRRELSEFLAKANS